MVSRAHLCSHHQSSSTYIWVCNTSSHHQLKNRIPPEITRSQLQCQEEHICLHQWLNYLSRLCKWWVINSLWKKQSSKIKMGANIIEDIWVICHLSAVVCPIEDGWGTGRVDFITSDQIWSDKLNCGFLRHPANTLRSCSFIIFAWLIILTQFTFVFIYCF